ncbi:MAG: DUF4163 domain-containing protein, partial [Oscillospiraceae bacterium]
MNKNELKKKYDSIEIPESLSANVDEAIFTGLEKNTKHWTVPKKIASLAAVFCFVFITLLNTNQAFASVMNDVPILGKIFRVFTFQEYNIEDKKKIIYVKIPHIKNVGNTDLEKRINSEISKIINEEVKQAEIRAEEYYKAFIDTGGKPEDFMPIEVSVDYEIKHSSNKYASFVVSKYETLASAYQEMYFYNIDLESGKIITLKDIYGTNYKDIVTKNIKSQISTWNEDKKFYLFKEVEIEDLITKDRSFYINKDNQVV